LAIFDKDRGKLVFKVRGVLEFICSNDSFHKYGFCEGKAVFIVAFRVARQLSSE
jgi:hypothetical protein